MSDTQLTSISYTDGDVDTNLTTNPSLEELAASRFSRRQMMFGGLTAASVAFMGMPLAGCGGDDDNTPPTVAAGGTLNTTAGKVVTLTGTANDTGSVSNVSWTQLDGSPVALQNANTLTASFLAPSVAGPTSFLFRLTATDDKGATSSVETRVNVDVAKLDFTAVAKNLNDLVTVPAGYTATVLYRLGDPILPGVAAYANDGTDTNFSARAGDHHDGMSYFGLAATGAARDDNNSTRGLLVMNHENITPGYLHPAGPTGSNAVSRPENEAFKEMECHGVSVVEVTRATTGGWSYVQGGALNRRITPMTPMRFNGPVRGSAMLRTLHSPDGTQGRGTINNCANGYMPWGTYATCEENWAGYFRRNTATDNANRTAKEVTALSRYGVTNANGNYGWSRVTPAVASNTIYARWNANVDTTKAADGTGDFRNEPNQFGWVVEIDPYDPASMPRKRTALGRMGHEGCWPSLLVAGRKPAFYMGDDSQNEYLYKFVSNAAWAPADANASDRLAIGDKYLDAGTLYVARFDANGTGAWLPLVFGTGPLTAAGYPAYAFADQADILVHPRIAADALGATRMDRPEWTAVNPYTGEVYLTLTNNSSRTLANTDAANPRYYNDPKGAAAQRGNPNGHIIRLRETGDNSESLTFTWDIYLFGAGSDLDAQNINLSGLDASNDLSSPDGLWFSRPTNAGGAVNPLLWIQTDDGAFTDQTNCMMLVGMPGVVGDGATRTITNTDAGGATRTQSTRVGAQPGAKLRRFLVGPKDCEITGIDSTPDGRTVFVNIQHPGDIGSSAPVAPYPSNWPANQTNSAASARPRSATVAITKNDGGVVGL